MARIAYAVMGAACLLMIAGAAHALYIMTPLRMTLPADPLQVGDEVKLTLEPEPEHENASQMPGTTVEIVVSLEQAENDPADPRDPLADGQTLGRIVLDGEGRGSFTLRVPAEWDDRNVQVQIRDMEGAILANGHFAVGDATPYIALKSEGAPAAPEAATARDPPEGLNATPLVGVGVLAIVVLALAALKRRSS